MDPKAIVRRAVRMVNPAKPDQPATPMIEVRYTYTDKAVVDVKFADRSAISTLLLGNDYEAKTSRVLKECTPNDADSKHFSDRLWFVVNADLKSCVSAVKQENDAILADRAKLKDPKAEVTLSQVDRLYQPATASLGPDTTNADATFPEYHRLFSGGVDKNSWW